MELELHEDASVRQYREVGAFVRYCVARIERDSELADWWSVKIVPARSGFACEVVVQRRQLVVQSRGAGLDGPLAAWDALCKVEQVLRESIGEER